MNKLTTNTLHSVSDLVNELIIIESENCETESQRMRLSSPVCLVPLISLMKSQTAPVAHCSVNLSHTFS